MEEILFRETATLGIRRYPVSRHKLKRQAAEVDTPFGPVKGKLGWLDGRPPTFSPEYEDCAKVAREQNVPLRDVYNAAHAAYAQATPVQATPAPAPAKHEHGHGHDHCNRSGDRARGRRVPLGGASEARADRGDPHDPPGGVLRQAGAGHALGRQPL